nr:hypothetical protein [Kibdelosporangium sp. MJ126-NF4]CEL22135.1 conserved hypothetical protein; putative secreted protein [Kibdelosporangium sp. MJ126-NF4]CTQ92916.1 conserved hypothetical protein; putative secreted protein [Kibdelosporangium sp. MJ126-NF4]
MSWRGWQEVIGVVGVFVLITVVLTVTIWQLAATWRAKANLAREQEYRTIAEGAVAAQQEVRRELAELNRQLTELRTRVDSVHRILSDVE